MRRYTVLLFSLLLAVAVAAQDSHERFSPEKFQAEMEQYVVREANLTQQEAARFLPVYAEMHTKMRAVYDQQRKLAKSKPADEQACREAVKKCDQLDLELKQLQQTYHNKFFNVLPAMKVYEVIRAENRFHREALKKKWNHRRHR